MMALMLPLPTEEKNEELYGQMPPVVLSKTTNYTRKFGFTHQETSLSAQTAKRRRGLREARYSRSEL